MALNFNPNHFANDSNVLTNPFFPLTPGKQFVYEGVTNSGGVLTDHQVLFTVTDIVRVINGVKCVVVWDQDITGGVLREAELAFFAQDIYGNVWSMGEYPELYENGVFTGAPDTWIHGTSDAQGGVHMLANPARTNSSQQPYLQGLIPSIEFHDVAQITDTGGTLQVGPTTYTNVLSTVEWNPDEPDVRQGKFYAPDVGIVQITAINDPEGETLNLTEVRQLDAAAMASARETALALEDRAYAETPIYGEADPAGRYEGTPGNDIINAAAGGNHINGGDGDDDLSGGPGDDDIDGGNGDDNLNGNADQDVLRGRTGDDTLNGGAGDDRLRGDIGADYFLFTDLSNGDVETDTIQDYNLREGDAIDLPDDAAIASTELVHGIWQLTLVGDGDVIRLPGVADVGRNGILNDLLIL
jgi:hypothetical protein